MFLVLATNTSKTCKYILMGGYYGGSYRLWNLFHEILSKD